MRFHCRRRCGSRVASVVRSVRAASGTRVRRRRWCAALLPPSSAERPRTSARTNTRSSPARCGCSRGSSRRRPALATRSSAKCAQARRGRAVRRPRDGRRSSCSSRRVARRPANEVSSAVGAAARDRRHDHGTSRARARARLVATACRDASPSSCGGAPATNTSIAATRATSAERRTACACAAGRRRARSRARRCSRRPSRRRRVGARAPDRGRPRRSRWRARRRCAPRSCGRGHAASASAPAIGSCASSSAVARSKTLRGASASSQHAPAASRRLAAPDSTASQVLSISLLARSSLRARVPRLLEDRAACASIAASASSSPTSSRSAAMRISASRQRGVAADRRRRARALGDAPRSSVRTRRWRGAADCCDAKHAQQRTLERGVVLEVGDAVVRAAWPRSSDEELLGEAGAARAHAAHVDAQPRVVRRLGAARLGDPRRALEQLLDVGEQHDLGGEARERAPDLVGAGPRSAADLSSAITRSSRAGIDVVAEQHAAHLGAQRLERRSACSRRAAPAADRPRTAARAGAARRRALAASPRPDRSPSSTSPAPTCWPARTRTSRTTPPTGAAKAISIFIASSRPSGCPASTASPTATWIATTMARRARAHLADASASRSGARGPRPRRAGRASVVVVQDAERAAADRRAPPRARRSSRSAPRRPAPSRCTR